MTNNKKYVFEIDKILCKKLKNNINATLIFQYLITKFGTKDDEVAVESSYFTDKFLMTGRELRTAINAISKTHKTYEEYLEAQNKFDDKLFATYFDFKEKKNIFVLARNNIDSFLFDLKYLVDDLKTDKKENNISINNEIDETKQNVTKIDNQETISVPEISFIKNNKLHIFSVDKFIVSNEKLKLSFENFFICRSQKIVTQQIVDYYTEQLKILSDLDIDTAIKICERSVLYNWSDLYALDKSKYSSGSNGRPKEKIWKTFDRMKTKNDEIFKKFKRDKEKKQFQKLNEIFGDDYQ